LARQREIELEKDEFYFDDEAEYSESPHVRREKLLHDLERIRQEKLETLNKEKPNLPEYEVKADVAMAVIDYADRIGKYDFALYDIWRQKLEESRAANAEVDRQWEAFSKKGKARAANMRA